MNDNLNAKNGHIPQAQTANEELERDLEFLEKTAGQGKSSPGWKWNRDEIYEERLRWPRH